MARQFSDIAECYTIRCHLAAVIDYVYYRNMSNQFSAFSQQNPFNLMIINSGFHATEYSIFRIWQVQSRFSSHCRIMLNWLPFDSENSVAEIG